ncbi:PilN domain-containing protein [Crenobacter caeni]|uniref:PilN domain-containing protein n=1 Tax=Crenobacter caeni TaxID=2705474 RepID=A0A6B2KTL9_9NEIS|nr:PilN domain-containing protein [Crenobacter caeni]NDV13454.1 PilN domain-containing protein [Crenobacter caeni]
MIRINLLPYRELRKAAHRKTFQLYLAGALGLAGALIAGAYLWQGSTLDTQLARNQRLDDAIAMMTARLGKVDNLRAQKAALLARKDMAMRLQEGRVEAVLLFDALVRDLPEGVYLKDFKQTERTVAISGYALSGARVSNYMSQLGNSAVFANPVLIEVKAAPQGNLRTSEFSLTVSLKARDVQATPTAPAQGAKP